MNSRNGKRIKFSKKRKTSKRVNSGKRKKTTTGNQKKRVGGKWKKMTGKRKKNPKWNKPKAKSKKIVEPATTSESSLVELLEGYQKRYGDYKMEVASSEVPEKSSVVVPPPQIIVEEEEEGKKNEGEKSGVVKETVPEEEEEEEEEEEGGNVPMSPQFGTTDDDHTFYNNIDRISSISPVPLVGLSEEEENMGKGGGPINPTKEDEVVEEEDIVKLNLEVKEVAIETVFKTPVAKQRKKKKVKKSTVKKTPRTKRKKRGGTVKKLLKKVVKKVVKNEKKRPREEDENDGTDKKEVEPKKKRRKQENGDPLSEQIAKLRKLLREEHQKTVNECKQRNDRVRLKNREREQESNKEIDDLDLQLRTEKKGVDDCERDWLKKKATYETNLARSSEQKSRIRRRYQDEMEDEENVPDWDIFYSKLK